jgi:hypothetical protein
VLFLFRVNLDKQHEVFFLIAITYFLACFKAIDNGHIKVQDDNIEGIARLQGLLIVLNCDKTVLSLSHLEFELFHER